MLSHIMCYNFFTAGRDVLLHGMTCSSYTAQQSAIIDVHCAACKMQLVLLTLPRAHAGAHCFQAEMCTAPYVLQHMYYTMCTAPYVLHLMYNTLCTATYVLQRMYYTLCSAPYVLNLLYFTLCTATLCTAPYVLHLVYCTQCTTCMYIHCRRCRVQVSLYVAPCVRACTASKIGVGGMHIIRTPRNICAPAHSMLPSMCCCKTCAVLPTCAVLLHNVCCTTCAVLHIIYGH